METTTIDLSAWLDEPIAENEDDLAWWVKYDQENNFNRTPKAMRYFERMDALDICLCGKPRRPYADGVSAMTCGDMECLRTFLLGRNGYDRNGRG